MILDVHLLTGESLKGLAPINANTHAAALGPEIAPVTAFWLGPRTGRYNHDFLCDPVMDGRVTLLAEALLRDFGRRRSPLLIIPDLDRAEAAASSQVSASAPPVLPADAPVEETIAEETLLDEPGPEELAPKELVPESGTEEAVLAEPTGPRSWFDVIEELRTAAEARGGKLRFLLRSVALEPVLPRNEIMLRLIRLAERLEAAGLCVAIPEGAVVLPEPESLLHTAILRNLRAQSLMEEMAIIGRRQGMEIADPARLLAYCDRSLQRWAEIGLTPALSNRMAFARLGERLFDRFPQEPKSLP